MLSRIKEWYNSEPRVNFLKIFLILVMLSNVYIQMVYKDMIAVYTNWDRFKCFQVMYGYTVNDTVSGGVILDKYNTTMERIKNNPVCYYPNTTFNFTLNLTR